MYTMTQYWQKLQQFWQTFDFVKLYLLATNISEIPKYIILYTIYYLLHTTYFNLLNVGSL